MIPPSRAKRLIVRNISYDVPESARELFMRIRRSIKRAVRDFFDDYFIDAMSITDRAAASAEKLEVFIRENFPKLVDDYTCMAQKLNRHIDAHPNSGLTSAHFQLVDIPGQEDEADDETSGMRNLSDKELFGPANKAPQGDSSSSTILADTQSTKDASYLTPPSSPVTMTDTPGKAAAPLRPHPDATNVQSAPLVAIPESFLTLDDLHSENDASFHHLDNTGSVSPSTLHHSPAPESPIASHEMGEPDDGDIAMIEAQPEASDRSDRHSKNTTAEAQKQKVFPSENGDPTDLWDHPLDIGTWEDGRQTIEEFDWDRPASPPLYIQQAQAKREATKMHIANGSDEIPAKPVQTESYRAQESPEEMEALRAELLANMVKHGLRRPG